MTTLETLCNDARSALARFWTNESGATAIEYAMIAGGVSVAVAGTVHSIGSSLKVNFYDKLSTAFN